MFGIGITELVLILVAALVFIGPDKLPEIARALGKAYTEFKRMIDELKSNVTEPVRGPESRGTRSADASGKHARPDYRK